MYKDESFWNRIASKYDTLEQKDVAYSIFIEKAGEYLKKDSTILDFGCGTGLVCNEIADKVHSIHAIDISSKMIEIARHKASQRKISNIVFERISLLEGTFKEASYDAVIAFNIFHLPEEIQTSLERIHKILKPGGLILSATPCMSEAPVLNRVLTFFSFLGLTPQLNAFSAAEMEQFFLAASFETIELNRIKPKSPQYLCISRKNFEKTLL